MFETDILIQEEIRKRKEDLYAALGNSPYQQEYTLTEPINELENMTKQYNVTNQVQAETAIKCSHYIVGSVDQYGHFSISNSPAIHVEVNGAKAEAKRLATNNPGKTFVVMNLTTGFRAGGLLEF